MDEQIAYMTLGCTQLYMHLVHPNQCYVTTICVCVDMCMYECPALQGLRKNKGNFTAEMVEAYKYVFSQPGALTAPLNYYRCIFKIMNMKMGTKKIEVPILVIWVSSSLFQYMDVMTITYCDDHYLLCSTLHGRVMMMPL